MKTIVEGSHRNIFKLAVFLSALFIISLCAPASTIAIANPAAADDLYYIYLPVIQVGVSSLQSVPCTASTQEQQVADRLINDPGQQRASLTCNAILAQVARERAIDMAERNYFSHVNPDGYGPNYLVRQAGYPLPGYYSQQPDANNIESIGVGYPDADAAWTGWMNSPGHHEHLLGLHSFYAEQIEYGVGYAFRSDSDYGHYWVVITAKQE